MGIKGEVTSINQTMKEQVKIHISLEDMETSKIQGKMKCKMKDMMNLNFNIKIWSNEYRSQFISNIYYVINMKNKLNS